MPEFIIPDEVKNKSVGDIGLRSDIVAYLRENGYATIRDVINNQDKIPNKYLTPIKAKLIFNIDV